ncbi:MAG TPA: glycosyl hydrolase, partial [Candidatus Paceibacterota bacterium]|nr:glycosyl hydrolase [Candidatus Paceibacterota bacterium]
MNCALNPYFAALFLVLTVFPKSLVLADNRLERDFAYPPNSARLRAYWWWLNGNVTKEAITRDLEQMKIQGFGGALICDADGASQDGNDRVPHGPDFFSPPWRELYRHTLREAHRLGLEMSLNIQSGWNLGGPMVKPDDAAKKLVWSELRIDGPQSYGEKLPAPKSRDGYYRDLFVVAYPVRNRPSDAPPRPAIQNWEQKAMHRALHFSAPDTTPLLQDAPATPGEEDTSSAEVLDLTSRLDSTGTLNWSIPPGTWMILRIGCTIGDHSRVSTSSDGWKGYALDVLDAGAFSRYWDAVIDPLIADAGPLAGRTLRYLHTDSWEVEAINWTPTLREEFRRRCGYDFLPYLPVITGRIVHSRPVSNRFLNDFRKTLGDLAIDNHFRLFRDRAHRHGLEIHPESGGPHAVPIDAQRCLGFNDVPMSEFWAWSWRHRVGESNRFFVKQPASAAHTYGRRLVAAEGFTTIGPHWQETLWDNLKPSFDRAACEGLNLLVWHAFTCSPDEMGLPGQEYFAGTHFNPNSTWWSRSGPF